MNPVTSSFTLVFTSLSFMAGKRNFPAENMHYLRFAARRKVAVIQLKLCKCDTPSNIYYPKKKLLQFSHFIDKLVYCLLLFWWMECENCSHFYSKFLNKNSELQPTSRLIAFNGFFIARGQPVKLYFVHCVISKSNFFKRRDSEQETVWQVTLVE